MTKWDRVRSSKLTGEHDTGELRRQDERDGEGCQESRHVVNEISHLHRGRDGRNVKLGKEGTMVNDARRGDRSRRDRRAP